MRVRKLGDPADQRSKRERRETLPFREERKRRGKNLGGKSRKKSTILSQWEFPPYHGERKEAQKNGTQKEKRSVLTNRPSRYENPATKKG